MCPDKHNFFNLNLGLPLKQQQRQFVVCVSIAVAHCLKIKGLSSKALTTAPWLLLRSSAGVWKFTSHPKKWIINLCTPKNSFPSVTFCFSLVTDHVDRGCGENPGWDAGVSWIPEGTFRKKPLCFMFKTCQISKSTCVFILIWYIPQVTGWSGYMVVRWFYRKDASFFLAAAANWWYAGWSPDAGGRGRRFSRAGSDHSGGHRTESFITPFIVVICRAGGWRFKLQLRASTAVKRK